MPFFARSRAGTRMRSDISVARRVRQPTWLHVATVMALVAVVFSSPAAARITELRLDPPEPFADGRAFGTAGPYVRIRGTARGAIDPADPAHAGIVDLGKAPRTSDGMVEYETDVFILRPSDPERGNGILLYEPTNRGRKFLLHWINEARSAIAAINDPKTVAHAGNGFLLERGYTIVWSGWDPDAPRAGGGLSIRLPIATDGGKPIVQRIRHEFQIGTRGAGDGLKVALPYPAHTTEPGKARLSVRARVRDAGEEVTNWAFLDRATLQLTGEPGRFEPLKIYEFWYEAQDPKVLGLGFAATRDLISFLRHQPKDSRGTPNPVMVQGNASTGAGTAGTGIRSTLALGISLGGRYLRHHLELGMNADVDGRRVFDGLLVYTAGAGKVFGNHRFGMPNRTTTQHEDRFYPEIWFPFGYHAARDPLTGRDGRLLAGTPVDPKIIDVNTSSEYWQKGASLIHIEADGLSDVRLPPNVRAYLIAGTQHGGRVGLDDKPGACALGRNPHNPAPVLRALLVALEHWVVEDRLPPASRVPRVDRRTATDAKGLRFPAMRGIAPPADVNPVGLPVDWIDPPNRHERTYRALVPRLDPDGNEIAGIRLPPIAVPLGTYTGWNYYRQYPTELCDRDGAFLPFARTPAERAAAGDSRPSLAERYRSPDIYVARVRAVAEALVRLRLLLPKDAEAYVEAAKGVAF